MNRKKGPWRKMFGNSNPKENFDKKMSKEDTGTVP